jgi:hypothetical protein
MIDPRLSGIVHCKVLPTIHNKGAGNDRLKTNETRKKGTCLEGMGNTIKEDRAKRNPNQSAQ